MTRVLRAVCLLLVVGHGAVAQELAVSGRVARPRSLDVAELRAAGAVVEGGFTGALLWPLLQAAGPAPGEPPREHLQRTLLARGRDGYAVALAIAELDPEFEGKAVIVAYARDGVALPGLRLVVPGDKRAGRAVRDLVEVEVR